MFLDSSLEMLQLCRAVRTCVSQMVTMRGSYRRIPESIQKILGIFTAVAVGPAQEKNQWLESGELLRRKQLCQATKVTFLNKHQSCFLENTVLSESHNCFIEQLVWNIRQNVIFIFIFYNCCTQHLQCLLVMPCKHHVLSLFNQQFGMGFSKSYNILCVTRTL